METGILVEFSGLMVLSQFNFIGATNQDFILIYNMSLCNRYRGGIRRTKIAMRLLFGCLLWCTAAPAQITSAVPDSSIIKIIDLPAREPFDTARSWHRVINPIVYLISDKDIYDHFGYEISTKFGEFDFANYPILRQRKKDNISIW